MVSKRLKIIIASIVASLLLIGGGIAFFVFYKKSNSNGYDQQTIDEIKAAGIAEGSAYRQYIDLLLEELEKAAGKDVEIAELEDIIDGYKSMTETINQQLDSQSETIEELAAAKLVTLRSLRDSLVGLIAIYTNELTDLNEQLDDIVSAIDQLEDIDSGEVVGFEYAKALIEQTIQNHQRNVTSLTTQLNDTNALIAELEPAD